MDTLYSNCPILNVILTNPIICYGLWLAATQYLYNGLWLSPTLLYIVVVAFGDDRKNDYNPKIIDVWWLGFADLT